MALGFVGPNQDSLALSTEIRSDVLHVCLVLQFPGPSYAVRVYNFMEIKDFNMKYLIQEQEVLCTTSKYRVPYLNSSGTGSFREADWWLPTRHTWSGLVFG